MSTCVKHEHRGNQTQVFILVITVRVNAVSECSGSCVPGVDQDDGDGSPPHLSGHLTPGTSNAKGGIETVLTHGPLDAVAVPHGDPHGHGDGRDEASEAELQQGDTQILTKLLGGSACEAG